MYPSNHCVPEDADIQTNCVGSAASDAPQTLGWGEGPHDNLWATKLDAAYTSSTNPAVSGVPTIPDSAASFPNAVALPFRPSDPDSSSSTVTQFPESSTPRSSGEAPIASACVSCRSRHLRCDGQDPCARCIANATKCTYIASRRGYNRKRRLQAPSDGTSRSTHTVKTTASKTVPLVSKTHPALNFILTEASINILHPRNISESQHGVSIPLPWAPNRDPANIPFSLNISASPSPAYALQPNLKDRCINSFYHYFFAAYPFVLPQKSLLLLNGLYPIEPVLAAIEWIGSLYIPGPDRFMLFQEACRLVYALDRKNDGFLVQAMLLLIIGLDGQRQSVQSMLQDITVLAAQIGLNTSAYAADNSLDATMAESWRRTWWELYIVDGLISAARGTAKFVTDSIPAEVALPCEENEYLSGDIPPPKYINEMDDSDVPDNDLVFSSFSYCIQAARIMGRIAKSPMTPDPKDETLAQMEKLLTSWRLNLPVSKQDLLIHGNRLDEMLFQAHMVIHSTSIYLHQPYSQLATSRDWDGELRSACTPVGAEKSYNIHTARVIHAAEQINHLITLPTPLLFHSHFFSYAIVISLLVHVGESASTFLPHKKDSIREGIRLSIGALNEFGKVWYTATSGAVRIKTSSRELARLKQQKS